MQYRKTSRESFANQATISRREWLEKALDSVRGLAQPDQLIPVPAEKPKRPNLYLVPDRPR